MLKSSKNNEESSKILKSSKTSEISQKKSDEQIKIPSQILKSSKTEEYSKILRSSKISQKNEPPLVRSVVSVEKDENSGSALKKSEFLDRKSSKQAEMKEKEENLKLSGIERNEENKEGKSIKISQNSDSDRRNEENKESFIREKIKNPGNAYVLNKSLKKSEVLSTCQNFNCQNNGETSKNFINSRCGHCFCSDCLQALFLEGKPTRCPKNLCFEKLDVGRAQAFLEGKEEEFEFEGEEGKNDRKEENGKKLSQRVRIIEDHAEKNESSFIKKTYRDVCNNPNCENHDYKHFFIVKGCGHTICEKCIKNCLYNGNMCLGSYCFVKIDEQDIKEFFEEKGIVLDNLKKSDLVMKDNLSFVKNQENLNSP